MFEYYVSHRGEKSVVGKSSKKEGLSRFRRRRSWSRRSKETKRFDEFDHIGNKERIERYENWICIKQQRAFFFGLKKRNTNTNTNNRRTHLPGDRVVEILRLPGKGELDDAKKRRRREERSCCCGSKRESVFGHLVLFVKLFLCGNWRLFFLCIFTLTFLLLGVVVVLKTNLFCVFRAMPSSLSSSANRVLVVVSLNDDLRSRVYRHRRHTTL